MISIGLGLSLTGHGMGKDAVVSESIYHRSLYDTVGAEEISYFFHLFRVLFQINCIDLTFLVCVIFISFFYFS